MHPMDPTAMRRSDLIRGTRDHVPVHVCFQGITLACAFDNDLLASLSGQQRGLQESARLYTIE
ncbi:hypothetical protein [Modicisalibacter xianhensis]|uniref:hypothetical protein n=1 Tax=Modicisalibacter xianhensis TaxID=442341 RepID=UPI001063D384|nr:hypothetical protein [Halomonas xianhensis]